MRLLFEMDMNDYDVNGKVSIRPSVRGIIIRDGKIGMVHSLKYDYYKFPGGGIESGENHIHTLVREVREESGLVVITDTVKEYGLVHRVQKGKKEDIFIQDNYYYICQVENDTVPQCLSEDEADAFFTLEFVDPMAVIEKNRDKKHGEKAHVMLEREARVLEMLIEDGYFKEK